jgi:hypothetical protein
MRNFGFCALVATAVSLLFVSCAAPQAPIGPPRSMAPGPTVQNGRRRGSWMLPEAGAQRSLLYAASNDIVEVYAYPGGRLLGSLGAFNGTQGLCADKTGDVFITAFGDDALYEYAHGGTTQIAVLRGPYPVIACAVDPKTDNAVAVSYGGATVFPYNRKRGYRFAKYYPFYPSSAIYEGAYCTYDAQGDLFVDGTLYQESGLALSELPKASATYENITLDESLKGPGAMQWIGNDLTVADRGSSSEQQPAVIYGFTIDGVTGKEVRKTHLMSSIAFAQFWIQGKRVVGPDTDSTSGVGIWDYPAGGIPSKSIAGAPPYGVVVSSK